MTLTGLYFYEDDNFYGTVRGEVSTGIYALSEMSSLGTGEADFYEVGQITLKPLPEMFSYVFTDDLSVLLELIA